MIGSTNLQLTLNNTSRERKTFMNLVIFFLQEILGQGISLIPGVVSLHGWKITVIIWLSGCAHHNTILETGLINFSPVRNTCTCPRSIASTVKGKAWGTKSMSAYGLMPCLSLCGYTVVNYCHQDATMCGCTIAALFHA